jgi:hypothetical protein
MEKVIKIKHYIRTLNGNIVQGFSDAFEVPSETDICINEDGQRHFSIDGKVNPSLFDEDGCPKYKFTNMIEELTEQEKIDWRAANIVPEIDADAELIEAISNASTIAQLKNALINGMGNSSIKGKKK